MKLHFPWSALTRAFEELDSAQTARTLYETNTGKGLWLVGDQGVYVMPNTTDGIHHKNDGKRVVVYARECDPTALEFDVWWANKQKTFGGDDGCEFIDIAEIRALASQHGSATNPPENLIITFSPGQLYIELEWPAPAKRSAKPPATTNKPLPPLAAPGKPLFFKTTLEEAELIQKIATRIFTSPNPPYADKMAAIVDISSAHALAAKLDLAALLAADDRNFWHDIFGIATHFDRSSGTFKPLFRPRYARD